MRGTVYRRRTWLPHAWRSPLGRRVDRVEGIVALLAVAVAMLAVPLMALTHVHMRTLQHGPAEDVTSGLPRQDRPAGGSEPSTRSAAMPDAASPARDQALVEDDLGTGLAAAGTGDHAASRGNPVYVGQPTTPSTSATLIADGVTGIGWVALVTAGYALVRRRLNRRRHAEWETAWKRLVGAGHPD